MNIYELSQFITCFGVYLLNKTNTCFEPLRTVKLFESCVAEGKRIAKETKEDAVLQISLIIFPNKGFK